MTRLKDYYSVHFPLTKQALKEDKSMAELSKDWPLEIWKWQEMELRGAIRREECKASSEENARILREKCNWFDK